MAIAFDANCSAVRTFSGGTSLDSNLSITVAANATVAVFVEVDTFSGAPTLTVSDGTNTFTQIATITYDTAAQNRVSIFLFQNPSSGAKTITITSSAAVFGKAWAASWTGLGTYSAANDPPVQTSGNSTTPATGSSATLSQADALILTAFGGNTTTWSGSPTLPPASGYTNLYNDPSAAPYEPVAFAYKIVSSTTAVSANIGTTASDQWGAVLAIIPQAAAGGSILRHQMEYN